LLLCYDNHIALNIFSINIELLKLLEELALKKPMQKLPMFQVLLLDNDKTDNVEVQEAKQVDFSLVKEHLKNGGSVFITSKKSQRVALPKARVQENYSRTRRNYGALFRQRLGSL
jgi:hypothetical protein